MADPQNPIKTSGMAMNGQAILTENLVKPLPSLPGPAKIVQVSRNAEQVPPSPEIDYSDLKSVNNELIALRTKYYLIRKDLAIAERAVVRTKWAYEGAKKRFMIQISGGTEKSREGAAELMAESEYGEFLVAQQVAKELTAYHRDLRADLDMLKELSNNLRRLISDL